MGSSEDESKVDVLIIGAGPAGLMAAAWMSRCGIKTRIIDKRGTKVFNGQADGFHSRTIEILDSFGLADRVNKEGHHFFENCFWNPDDKGRLRRANRVPGTIPGISRFNNQVMLHQGRIERFFLDFIKQQSNIEVERGVLPDLLEVDVSKAEDPTAHAVKVRLRHLTDEEVTPEQGKSHILLENGPAADILFGSNIDFDETNDLIRKNRRSGTSEVVHAKYVIGCDGAHSWTRKRLGFKMEGEETDVVFGALDIIPITDFPDIRTNCAIHSADCGTVVVIPRENKLVRLYIQLTETNGEGEAFDRSNITPLTILTAAQKIMAPYKLSYKYCDWWTAYRIGQRVADHFTASERIFLAGDAVHTHSPKAGQGMNVSMQDTYNLSWKVAGVVNGTHKFHVLKTYESERRRIAQELIEFDHKFSGLISARPAKGEEIDLQQKLKNIFNESHWFASGIGVNYVPSILVAKAKDDHEKEEYSTSSVVSQQEFASGIQVGMRMPSFKVLNQADSRPWHFQERLTSDGRWRLVIFAGNLTLPSQMTALKTLCSELSAPNSFLARFTPKNKKIDSVIEILTVHYLEREKIELPDLPEILHPFDEDEGWDYEKVFVDAPSHYEGWAEAYKGYGVDPESGCLVVLRPDQYVGYVGELGGYEAVDKYFAGILVPQ